MSLGQAGIADLESYCVAVSMYTKVDMEL